jgi:hypothetical protein
MKSSHLMVASNNTWQGIVYSDWPYEKSPPAVTRDLDLGKVGFTQIALNENLWNYRDGEEYFNLCMNRINGNHCKSIFDVRTFKNDSR